MSLGWSVFAASMHTGRLEEDLVDGIKAAIELYYEEYSQCESLYDEPKYAAALQTVMERGGGVMEEELLELVLEVEDDMVARRARDCDGTVRKFTTERPEED